ncbi:MAG: shikimate dehydrogenase, partial [Pirellulales bacterium]
TSDLPTVGMCMGEMGTPSRILGGRFGAPFTYATFHHERALAPGQLSFQEMKDVYHYDAINRETNVYAVIGDPIGHSLSPLVHNAAFRAEGINAVYIPFRVPKSQLKKFLTDAPLFGIRGLSVTIPHKETSLRVATKLDRAAREIGAVNTIVFENNGMTGYNTDCRAAMDSLAQATPAAAEEQGLAGRTCLVLGAGGAARAICYGLKRRGATVVIASRTREKADKLADALDCKAIDWSARSITSFDVLVNCTPVGMHPDVDASPFEKHHLKPSHVVFDTVYNPETTLLLKNARSQSCKIVTGLEMFVRQAALQFKLFTGHAAPVDLMRDTVRRAIGPA